MYGPEYQDLINTSEMDYRMEKMRKITKKTLGFEDKMVFFRWIAKRISSNGKNVVWIVGSPGWSHRRYRRVPSTSRAIRLGGLWPDTGCVHPLVMMF